MIRILGAALAIWILLPAGLTAQDTLPGFNAVAKGNNRNLISWSNNYPYISQLSIQRSADSLKNFKTILTVPDPSVPQNGFVDTKSPLPGMFYRLFIVMDSGKYVFSKSKRPAPDTVKLTRVATVPQPEKRVFLSDSMSNKEVKDLREKLQPKKETIPKPEKYFFIKRRDTLLASVSEKNFKKFKDSIVFNTRDTLVFQTADTILIKSFIPVEVYKASRYVYTEKFGNVQVSLSDAQQKSYSLKFFDESKKELFDIKKVSVPYLTIDKSNFLHAGWFWFELYEDGKLKEKHKFLIPKDF